ncbi:FG-GAP repeat domain protein [Verrucomicrobiia bacterium DG1235]|nr:FG-GAP repeat domain protein [Verrucomicrobiae bacterium DG1235]
MISQRSFAILATICVASASAKFVDVTNSSGIGDFERVERPLATQEFVVRGGQPIVMDFDQNGWQDIYIVRFGLPDIIYLNEAGSFTRVDNPLGLDTTNGGNGAAYADIDNDGDKDFVLSTADEKRYRLYINLGNGTYEEQAQTRGFDLPSDVDHKGTSVALGDVNRDGYLDIFTGDWGVEDVEETYQQHYALFLNQGAANPGHFTNATAEAGIVFNSPRADFFTPNITDLDQDGWPDLAVLVDNGKSKLYWNNANGTFTDTTAESGTARENHGMGSAIGDIDGDGDLDWFVTTIAMDLSGENVENNQLYINQGNRLFVNRSRDAGMHFGGWAWGTNMFDYDNDADLDVVLVNNENVSNIDGQAGPLVDGPMRLWRNNDPATLDFSDVSNLENANHAAWGVGILNFDYDKDGDLDLFAVHQFSRPILLRNDLKNSPPHLRLSLEGTVSNPDAYGAFVTLQATEDGPIQVREYNPTNAYMAQLEPFLHFGLGDHEDETIHKITVRWPSSIVQEFTDVAINQTFPIVENEALLEGTEIPVFASQPSDLVATRGQTLDLAVSIEGGFRPTITWYRNGILLAGLEGPAITLDNMQPRNAGTYHAIATNSAGSTLTNTFVIGVRSDFSDRNIARQLNELILDSARINFPDPPIVARTFFHASAAMWDAFWTYQPDGWGNAKHLFHREDLTQTDWHGDRLASQAEALSHAVFTVAKERYRTAFNHDAIHLALDDFMLEHGYDPADSSIEGNSPAAVGNRIGSAILTLSLDDGSNEANGYADTTGYAPVNEPLTYGASGVTLVDPNRWQPLNLTRSVTKNGIDLGAEIQQFLTPGWNWVTPFALEKPTESTILIDPGPQPLFGTETEPQLIAELVEVIRASSIMDPAQDVIIDASPGSLQQNNPYLTQDGQGHPLNPFTGQPYAENLVNQGDYFRITAEFWSDGPGIEGPPGVWNMLHNQTTDDPRFIRRLGGVGPELTPLEWDVHAYLALNGALHDAAIAAWTIKSKYDSIRPISMIRYLASLGQSTDQSHPSYHPSGLPLEPGLIELITPESSAPGQRHALLAEFVGELAIYSWRGVPQNPRENNAGVGWGRAANWSPYHLRTFPTPNFAGYVSGHSTFSRAGAEVMSLLTGSPYFPGGLKEFYFPAGEYLQVEYGPREPVTVQVATYYDTADITGVARIYCGVHIAADDIVGRKVGARVGIDSVLKTLALRQGAFAPEGFLEPRLQLPLAPGQDSPLITYKSQSPAKLSPAAAASHVDVTFDPGLFIAPADSGQVQFISRHQHFSSFNVEGLANQDAPIILDFQIATDEPVTLLATGLTEDETPVTLSLYQKSDESYQLLASNQNWLQHPSASIASIYANRRNLQGAELEVSASALPLTLSLGSYRITLSSSQEQPLPATLALEIVTSEQATSR